MITPTKISILLSTIALCLGAASASSACEPLPTDQKLKRVKFSSDGSFKDAGRGAYGTSSGGPVVDLGLGRVAQRVFVGFDTCSGSEVMFFMECETGNGILIWGTESKGLPSGFTSSSVNDLQPPVGPIKLTSLSTVAELEKIALENEFRYSQDMSAFWRENDNLKRIKIGRACKLHYTNSIGAKL